MKAISAVFIALLFICTSLVAGNTLKNPVKVSKVIEVLENVDKLFMPGDTLIHAIYIPPEEALRQAANRIEEERKVTKEFRLLIEKLKSDGCN